MNSPLNRIAAALERLADIEWQNQQLNLWAYHRTKNGTWYRIHKWTHCQEWWYPLSDRQGYWAREADGTMPNHQLPEVPEWKYGEAQFANYPQGAIYQFSQEEMDEIVQREDQGDIDEEVARKDAE